MYSSLPTVRVQSATVAPDGRGYAVADNPNRAASLLAVRLRMRYALAVTVKRHDVGATVAAPGCRPWTFIARA